MKLINKVKYAIFGDKPDKKTGLRPIEEAVRQGDIDAVLYYRSKGAKEETPNGKHILDCSTSMNTIKKLMAQHIYPSDKNHLKKIIQNVMFRDLNSLTPENIAFCRMGGISLGSALPDGTTFMTQKNRSNEQKQIWLKHARPEQIAHEFRAAALRDDTDLVKFLFKSGKIHVDTPNQEGKTALWYAGRAGHFKTAAYLASIGATLAVSDNQGRSAFETATGKKILQPLLYQAISSNNLKQTNELFTAGATVKDSQLIRYANTPEMAESLWMKGAPYLDELDSLKLADKQRDEITPASYAWKIELLSSFAIQDSKKKKQNEIKPKSIVSLHDGSR